jgi:hypothetical protein
MKKLSLLLLLLLFLFSCQKTELQFSCDPEIDAFVTGNLKSLSVLNFSELSDYKLPLQRAIFNSWNAEKKRDAWIDKLYFVLENESFSEAEAMHLQELIDHIYPGYFLEEALQQEKENRSRFAADWIAFASDKLEWPEQYIAFMVYRLYGTFSEMEAELSMLRGLEGAVTTNSESGGCGCSTSSDYCGTSSDCSSGECSSSPTGCGWLFNKPCDGLCY